MCAITKFQRRREFSLTCLFLAVVMPIDASLWAPHCGVHIMDGSGLSDEEDIESGFGQKSRHPSLKEASGYETTDASEDASSITSSIVCRFGSMEDLLGETSDGISGDEEPEGSLTFSLSSHSFIYEGTLETSSDTSSVSSSGFIDEEVADIIKGVAIKKRISFLSESRGDSGFEDMPNLGAHKDGIEDVDDDVLVRLKRIAPEVGRAKQLAEVLKDRYPLTSNPLQMKRRRTF